MSDVPAALVKPWLRGFLRLFFRVELRNPENFKKAGDRVLIIANHSSLMDAVLIAAFMPERVTFAVNSQMAKKWWVMPLLTLVDAFPMEPANPMAVRSLIEEIRKDRKCMIFPEGRITVTGALMKIYEGSGLIAEKSGAMVLPARIDGANRSKLSYMRRAHRTEWFPKITITLLEPRRFEIPPEIKGRERRRKISMKFYDVMAEMIYQTSPIDENIFVSMLKASKIYGSGHRIAEDISRKVLSYSQLIRKSYILGNALDKYLAPGERLVGVMLPNALPAVVTFWGLTARGKVPCMVNFSSGPAAVKAACAAAQVKTVITARRLIEVGRLEALEAAMKDAGLRLVYLEDVRKELSFFRVAEGMIHSFLRLKPKAGPNEPAAVLFTSGSEGTPKAVFLSHRNLQANRAQTLSVMPVGPGDRIFNCLPMFHSFGLGIGTVLPALSGIRTFYYPSPLHYRTIPELFYDSSSTIIFGTDTFMAAYGRVAHPYDFFSLRIAVVGAEKLRDFTASLWMSKFGIRIFEGYGATEMSPVISVNTPMYCKYGTVGRPLPGVTCRLEPVPGIETGGRLLLKGDTAMLGYMFLENPGVLRPPKDGWHDTGDIVEIDSDGFIIIKGRAKRFAKIAGEMVSLAAVETAAGKLWPNALSAVVALPDAKKGEQLVLITSYMKADIPSLTKFFAEEGLSPLSVPRRIITLRHPPVLGSGKPDLQACKKIAEETLKSAESASGG
jgi:acyl-[acyl-carrier-protein]-phospholipid O-acyltransferase/long-chain-fatty-acid--[acyl-carrier-protein] ligase